MAKKRSKLFLIGLLSLCALVLASGIASLGVARAGGDSTKFSYNTDVVAKWGEWSYSENNATVANKEKWWNDFLVTSYSPSKNDYVVYRTDMKVLTGGGAEMQHIEELFAREMKAIEVRAVYPEYGFTETMTEHISTSAYATAASLLVYGANRGSCNIAVRVQREEPRQTEPRQMEPRQAEPRREEPRQVAEPEERTRPNIGTMPPRQAEPEVAAIPEVDDAEFGFEEDDQPKRKGRGLVGRMKSLMEKMSNSFTDSDDELEL